MSNNPDIKDKAAEIKRKANATKRKTKAKKARIVAKVAGAFILISAAGCQLTPSRSINQRFDNCHITINAATNTPGDILSCNMVIETSGQETQSPSYSVQPSTSLSYGSGSNQLESLVDGVVKSLQSGGGESSATTPSCTGSACTPQ